MFWWNHHNHFVSQTEVKITGEKCLDPVSRLPNTELLLKTSAFWFLHVSIKHTGARVVESFVMFVHVFSNSGRNKCIFVTYSSAVGGMRPQAACHSLFLWLFPVCARTGSTAQKCHLHLTVDSFHTTNIRCCFSHTRVT